jgi:catecholate siderophore receptor
VRLNVLNVSDEEYFESVYTGHVVPGAGRTFLLTASFQF